MTDPDATAVHARRIVANSCTALHGLLRSEGSGYGDTTAAAAAAAAQALTPTLEAFVSLSFSTAKNPSATPSSAVAASSFAGTIAWQRGGNAGNGGGSNPTAATADGTVGRDGGQAHHGSWQDASRAVSLLLDFVDGVVETTSVYESNRGPYGEGNNKGPRVAHQQRRPDNEAFFPPTHTRQHQQPFKPTAMANRATKKRVWAEVRGLCCGDAGARAASSRRLAALLEGAVTFPEDGGGNDEHGGVRSTSVHARTC